MKTANDKGDHLCLSGNHSVRNMLLKYGKNKPNPEKVVFSDFVIKINRRDKEQTRVMLVTDKAMYNLMPNNYANMKRRIAIDKVGSITCSEVSDEFVIHVPEEYDYRFKSAKKDKVADIMGNLYKALMEKETKDKSKTKLNIKYKNESDLKDTTVTKVQAKSFTRDDIQARIAKMRERARGDSEDDAKDEEGMDDIAPLGALSQEKIKMEDFKILKVLGRGSFGKVMLVEKKSDKKHFAMKVLKKRAIIQRGQVEHTKAERKILQQAHHPFLMTLRYAFQTKEKLYMVLDYLQGGELFFHLRKNRRFPEDVARIYVAEIACALGHLHSVNVIYRDLKPENILLDDNGHLCLTDFGLSKDVGPDEKAHTFCGTPEYLAPEIVVGAGHDKAVDWWSLGILLYELTVGVPPFYSQNVNEMYNKIQHGVLRFPPFLSENCKNLIIELLNRDPKKRCGSKNDVDDIKKHAFYKDMNWEKLLKKQIDIAYKPDIKQSNFDETFTAEPAVDSMVASSALSQTLSNEGDSFGGFTFQDKKGPLS
jgi:serum/glucocorticoid-regulated kinase 2